MNLNNNFIEATNSEGEKMKIEVSWEENIWEWVRIFKVILKWLDFADETIEKAFGKEE